MDSVGRAVGQSSSSQTKPVFREYPPISAIRSARAESSKDRAGAEVWGIIAVSLLQESKIGSIVKTASLHFWISSSCRTWRGLGFEYSFICSFVLFLVLVVCPYRTRSGIHSQTRLWSCCYLNKIRPADPKRLRVSRSVGRTPSRCVTPPQRPENGFLASCRERVSGNSGNTIGALRLAVWSKERHMENEGGKERRKDKFNKV